MVFVVTSEKKDALGDILLKIFNRQVRLSTLDKDSRIEVLNTFIERYL